MIEGTLDAARRLLRIGHQNRDEAWSLVVISTLTRRFSWCFARQGEAPRKAPGEGRSHDEISFCNSLLGPSLQVGLDEFFQISIQHAVHITDLYFSPVILYK